MIQVREHHEPVNRIVIGLPSTAVHKLTQVHLGILDQFEGTSLVDLARPDRTQCRQVRLRDHLLLSAFGYP